MAQPRAIHRRHAQRAGGLPHLSFVDRKPEPLGTEGKTSADGQTGFMMRFDIQEGAEANKTNDMDILQQPAVEFSGIAQLEQRLKDRFTCQSREILK